MDSLTLATAIPGLDVVPVIGILRRCPPKEAVPVVTAVVNAGLRVVEVTLDSEDVLHQIASLTRAVPEATLGVGTVTRSDQVGPAVEAGASFVVSPTVSPPVIDACVALDVPSIPGAATPTEIMRALEAGATAVKVFPVAQLGGPGYLRAILHPLGDPPLVPTGGVTPEDAGAYLAARAVAVGAGSSLFSLSALEAGDVKDVGNRAARWVEAVK